MDLAVTEGYCELCNEFYDLADIGLACLSCREPIQEARVTPCDMDECRDELHHFGVDAHVEVIL